MMRGWIDRLNRWLDVQAAEAMARTVIKYGKRMDLMQRLHYFREMRQSLRNAGWGDEKIDGWLNERLSFPT